MKAKAIWIGTTAVLLLASFWQPIYLFEQALQHVPTIIGLAGLAVAARRNWLGTGAIAAICLFLWLHILGARYIYTYVPYDRWSAQVAGTSIGEALGWQRNHYDRLVHLLFGILGSIPLYETARRYGGMNRGWSTLLAAACVLSIGGIYEVFEWTLTLFVAPELAQRYNGQQGDIWDPQKDMALGMLGVLIFAVASQTRWRLPRNFRKR
jgi:putative membrane protein